MIPRASLLDRRPSLGARVVGVFASPYSTFRAIDGDPPWRDALALGIGLGLLNLVLLPWEPLRDMVGQATDVQLPGEQTLRLILYAAGAAALLVTLLSVAFGGGAVLYGVFTLLFGGRAGYRALLSVAAHSLLVVVVGSLLVLPVQMAQGRLDAGVNLSLLVPFLDPGSPVRDFLSRVNPFSVWALLVAAAGAAATHGGISWRRASLVLLALYLSVLAVGALR